MPDPFTEADFAEPFTEADFKTDALPQPERVPGFWAGIGRVLSGAGRIARDIAGAYALEATGQPLAQARQLGITAPQLEQLGIPRRLIEQELSPSEIAGAQPIEEGMRQLSTAARLPAEAAYGLVESVPRLAMAAGVTLAATPVLGPAALPVGGAVAFGPTEEGFSVKEAAIGAALPYIGKFGGGIVGQLAKRLGVTGEQALRIYEAAGGSGAAASILGGLNELEIRQLPPEEQDEARIKAIANTMGQFVLGAVGGLQPGLQRAARDRTVVEAADRARQVGLEKAALEAEAELFIPTPERLATLTRPSRVRPAQEPPVVIGAPPPMPQALEIPGFPVAQPQPIVPVSRGTPVDIARETRGKISFGAEAPTLAPQPLPERTLAALREELAAPAAQPQEINAPIQRIEPGNRVEERVGTDALRQTAEAGGGNRPVEGARVEPAQIPEAPGQAGIQAPDRPLLLIDRLANTTGREFEALMQEPGMRGTEAAMRLGQAARSSPDAPALVQRLQQAHEQARQQSQDARARGDMGEVLALSTKPQYFREALQSATGQTPELVRMVIGEAESGKPSPEALGIVPPGTALALETVGNPSWWRRHFTSSRGLPENVPQSWLERMGTVRSETRAAAYASRDLATALRKLYGIGPLRNLWEALSGVPRPVFEQIQTVLTGVSDLNSLAPELRGPVERMRQHVDSLSQQIAEGLRAEGKPELAAAIDENLNAYLTRSYRIFDDPKWLKNIPANVRANAEAYIAEQLSTARPDLVPAAARELAATRLREMLADWSDAGLDKLFRSGKLGSKDLSIFMRRKELAPEIRAVMGEYGDPVTNYARTITKQSRWLADTAFLNRVRELGLGKWLFEEGQAPAGFEHQIAAESSSTMAPLNGLRTSPEIAQIFEQFNRHPVSENFLARLYFGVNAWSKQAKTVFSALTQGRNLIGNPFFNVSAGHWNFQDYGKAFRAQWADIAGSAANAREFYRDMARHGITDENPITSDLRASMRDAGLQDPNFTDYTLKGWARVLKTVVSAPQRAYRLPDEMGKTVGWLAERSDFAKAHPDWSEAQVKTAAAERVRNTYPTYSMLPEWMQAFRKQPVVGPFVSFGYEAIRNATWNLRYGVQDLRSGNAARAVSGARRLAGTAAVIASGAALSSASRALLGIQKDTEDDVRRFLPPWSKNSQVVWLDKDGPKLRFLNWSYLNPSSGLSDPFVAALSGDDKGMLDRSVSAFAEFVRPFANEQMLAAAFADVARNKTAEGAAVYNEQDDFETKFSKASERLVRAVLPGTVERVQRRIVPALHGKTTASGQSLRASAEIGSELTGLRTEALDLLRAAEFKARDFVRGERDARKIATTLLFAANPPTPEAGREAYQRADAARKALWTEMQGDLRALFRQGASTSDVMRMLEKAGISRSDQLALLSGRYVPLKITAQNYRDAGKTPDWNVLVPIMTERLRQSVR